MVIALMAAIAENMAVDPQWQEDIINPVQVAGVSRVSHTGMEIMIRIVVSSSASWEKGSRCSRKSRTILVSIKTLTEDTSPPVALPALLLLLHQLGQVGLFLISPSSVELH